MAVSVAALVACNSKKDGDAAKPAALATEKPAVAETPKVVTGESLFTGTTAALPTPAAKLHLGMTEAEAKAAAPELFKDKYVYAVPNTLDPSKHDSVRLAMQLRKNWLWNLRIDLLDSQDVAKAYLTKKWGEPIARKSSIGTPEYYWNAPATGLRAELEQVATKSAVDFTGMMKRDDLLGADPKHFAFDVPTLLGATAEDAVKILAAHQSNAPMTDPNDPNRIMVQFLPTENDFALGDTLELRLKDGKVIGYALGFGGDANDTDALVAKLESIYGKGKLDGTGLYTVFPGSTPVKAEIRRDTGFMSSVWVGSTAK